MTLRPDAAEHISISRALAHARALLAQDPHLALAQLAEVIGVAPQLADAHRLAGRAHRLLGHEAEAEAAEVDAIRMSIHDPLLIEAGKALFDNELHQAESLLRARLREEPTDVAAIRMMAELAARLGRYPDAETLLRRALELAPSFGAARANLATVLCRQHRFAEAVEELGRLEQMDAEEAQRPSSLSLKAAALGRIGGYEEALDLYLQLTEMFPGQAKLWMSYGHLLKTVGRRDEGIVAYRRALEIDPGLGEVWWSLANLKTVRFTAADISAMERAVADPDAARPLTDEDRFHLHFALGKAREDMAEFEASFVHYAAGNRQRRAQLAYDPSDVSAHVDAIISCFTSEFVAARAGGGHAASDPVFVVGMPRAGSTLIEQILSSHSSIEGTMELPDLPILAAHEGRKHGAGVAAWVEALAAADPERRADLGLHYLERTRIQRKEGCPFFIDKLPNNWVYTGLIHLILPNAKIIDARRNPLDCCFSNFKQHFAKGQPFSYDLADMGRYYADYVRLMRHFDHILPGRVHRVIHEALLDNPEGETRRLLEYVGVPFEDACLRFHENKRAVRTASSEQVRRPLNREGVGQWRGYSRWLDPLRDALGAVLEAYPDAPEA